MKNKKLVIILSVVVSLVIIGATAGIIIFFSGDKPSQTILSETTDSSEEVEETKETLRDFQLEEEKAEQDSEKVEQATDKAEQDSDKTESVKLSSQQAQELYKNAYMLWSDWLDINSFTYMEYPVVSIERYNEQSQWEEYYIKTAYPGIDSISALKEKFSEFFVKDVYEKVIDESCIEEDSGLYVWSMDGGDAYEMKLDTISATLVSEEENRAVYRIKIDNVFSDRNMDKEIAFVYKDGRWLVESGDWARGIYYYSGKREKEEAFRSGDLFEEISTTAKESEAAVSDEPAEFTGEDAAQLYIDCYVWSSQWLDRNGNQEIFSNEDTYYDNNEYFGGNCPHYRVKKENINSLEDMKGLLKEYFSEPAAETILGNVFREKDGKLYRAVSGAGDAFTVYIYQAEAELVSSEENRITYKINVPSGYFEEISMGGAEYSFIKNDEGKWVFEEPWEIAIFPYSKEE